MCTIHISTYSVHVHVPSMIACGVSAALLVLGDGVAMAVGVVTWFLVGVALFNDSLDRTAGDELDVFLEGLTGFLADDAAPLPLPGRVLSSSNKPSSSSCFVPSFAACRERLQSMCRRIIAT